MNKTLFAVLAASLGFAAFSSFAADAPVLADRHVARSVTCDKCHGSQPPQAGAKVKVEQCLTCHQSYDTVAERTAKIEPNPHKNHLGNVRCSDCHSGHAQPKNMCNDCHKFNFNVK